MQVAKENNYAEMICGFVRKETVGLNRIWGLLV